MIDKTEVDDAVQRLSKLIADFTEKNPIVKAAITSHFWICPACQELNHYSERTCQDCGSNPDDYSTEPDDALIIEAIHALLRPYHDGYEDPEIKMAKEINRW